MIGNGGYSSQIRYDQLAGLIKAGDAAVATDTGHQGDGLEFGFDNDDAIEDWGHRAVHESIVASKVLTAQFYGKPSIRSYFAGCSTGGHQGLMEAQRYPADFDGILAGDPGNNRTNLNLGFLWQFLANHPSKDNSRPLLTVDDLKRVNARALEECDDDDGVKDGIITNPRTCRFKPEMLHCVKEANASCLSTDKITALRRMYDGARRKDTGRQIYPGWPVGSEYLEGAGGWNNYWANPQKPDEPQRVDFFRRWAFKDNAWNWYRFDWAKDIDFVHTRLGAMVDATRADLSGFFKHGGKIILYQGTADPVVSATDTVNYYKRVLKSNTHSAEASRLFLVPGMAHCAGGPGASAIAPGTDAEHDVSLALRRWVETGMPPSRIIATRYKQGSAASGIAMTRPICAWPKMPAYKGSGDTNDAQNFNCR